jgi:DNA-binding transcriptional regulator YiaG
MVIMAEEGVKFGNQLVLELLKMRQENGKPMTQYRLAQALSVTDQCVYKWVKGQSSPMRENYEKMRKYEDFLKILHRIKPFGK